MDQFRIQVNKHHCYYWNFMDNKIKYIVKDKHDKYNYRVDFGFIPYFYLKSLN